MNAPVPPLRAQAPGIGEDVAAIVERGLEKEPGRRWQSMREFADALAGARQRYLADAAALEAGEGAHGAPASSIGPGTVLPRPRAFDTVPMPAPPEMDAPAQPAATREPSREAPRRADTENKVWAEGPLEAELDRIAQEEARERWLERERAEAVETERKQAEIAALVQARRRAYAGQLEPQPVRALAAAAASAPPARQRGHRWMWTAPILG